MSSYVGSFASYLNNTLLFSSCQPWTLKKILANCNAESQLNTLQISMSCKFFYFDLSPRRAPIRMDERLVDWHKGVSRDGHIFGSGLQANMKSINTSYALDWKTISNPHGLQSRNPSNSTMNLMDGFMLTQDD